LDLGLIAALAHRRGNDKVAAEVVGAAEALRERVGVQLLGDEGNLHDETVRQLRQALGQEQYEAAAAEGQAMPLDDAVELASQALRAH
jgi:hypothetical protein